jgi:hypothetical protein
MDMAKVFWICCAIILLWFALPAVARWMDRIFACKHVVAYPDPKCRKWGALVDLTEL